MARRVASRKIASAKSRSEIYRNPIDSQRGAQLTSHDVPTSRVSWHFSSAAAHKLCASAVLSSKGAHGDYPIWAMKWHLKPSTRLKTGALGVTGHQSPCFNVKHVKFEASFVPASSSPFGMIDSGVSAREHLKPEFEADPLQFLTGSHPPGELLFESSQEAGSGENWYQYKAPRLGKALFPRSKCFFVPFSLRFLLSRR